MEVEDVSPALRQRLGPDATIGLLALLEASRKDWAQDVINQAVERFEREFTRQIGGLREEMREGFASLRAELRDGDAALRAEMRDGDAALRAEIRDGDATLRAEMREGDAALRLEMREGDAAIRLEMRDQRVELLKWSFAFWVAQFVSVGGLMAILLRSFLP
jgi:hypothetical protein